MLVLTRRAGESVVIGDGIVVTIIDVRGDGVRIGIDAPRSVRVHRAEVLAAVETANAQATVPDEDAQATVDALRAIRPPADRTAPEAPSA
ncbi:carbon storage regulator CsrA [Cellulomonas gilvus]|uniref:Translational regulator CsrA n=1 Tax=Cellulomonas gilvus (strain ATCC 13127 / NRRL B-14078) TaxID=593907 RepID=F8A5Y9_CELGA|nr:carbon storage regulator CsrA [Cellulomonas gilvus]AEI11004.1 carbon storage regulator, CsrA [Cellulomonas gilvus ATCC 13127]